jgi:hypothetical protein
MFSPRLFDGVDPELRASGQSIFNERLLTCAASGLDIRGARRGRHNSDIHCVAPSGPGCV